MIKYIVTILLISLLLAGCKIGFYNSKIDPQTSDELSENAVRFCKDEPELDGQKLYCQIGYIIETCKVQNLDLQVCDIWKKNND